MLLRRISQHVKEQNWFAVFLDFFIVVVGILIAFQVTSWNEARSANQTEKRLVERLVNDLNGMRLIFLRSDEIAMRTHQGWIHAFRALENCESNPQHEEAIKFALSRYQSSLSPDIQRSAFDEMQSTGTFSRLEDPGLKNEIVGFYAALENEVVSRMGERNNQLAAGRIMWKSIAFSYADDDPYAKDTFIGDSTGSTTFDPTRHCDNLELRGAVWEMVDVNRDWLNSSAVTIAQIDSLMSQLKEIH